MFTYFEAYMPENWEGLVKRGFINKDSGLRFCQNIMLDDAVKFNRLAAKDGGFYNLARDMDCPTYIDRLQGGCYIDEYPYDARLLDEYRSLLGDKFHGFQLHEWMSNYCSDIGKLERGGCTEWSETAITAAIKKLFPYKYLFLEAMTAAEMSALGKPKDAADYYSHMTWLFEKRREQVGELVPCDSAFLAFKLELEHGARRFMPEIGAQSADSRLQISYARSIAKAYKKSFGVYYEPWGGDPFSACCYQRERKNEWGIGGPGDFAFETKGDNGGSSRSLQKRIHLYSYLSGADFMSEEWGMSNTFYDWNDFEVSPYGKVKLDFHAFRAKYPDPGEKLAPIALVLPAKLTVLESIHSYNTFCGYPLQDSDASAMTFIKQNIEKVFSAPTEMLGSETRSLINSDIPDAVDIVHEDAQNLDEYRYLCDLTCGGALKAKYDNLIEADEIPRKLDEILPCTVGGGLHYMINKKRDGGYYLIIFNHSGIRRSVAGGEAVLSQATKTAEVEIKHGSALTRLEGSGDITAENGKYYITLGAGDWFFGEF